MSRTLPLSLSGALLGIALAAADYRVDWKTALFLVLAAIYFTAIVKDAKEYAAIDPPHKLS